VPPWFNERVTNFGLHFGERLGHAAALALIFVAGLWAGQSETGSVSVDQNITYATVNGTDLHLDAYEPGDSAARSRPAVILIHGGSWSSLDKSTMSGMGRFLARSGYVAFGVDYRLFEDHRNRWPAQLEDVQQAVRWMRANAAKYHIDPAHIGAFGHSAGAQLAALLGMEDTRGERGIPLPEFSSEVQAVVDVSGPTDFTRDHDADGEAFFARFFGSKNQNAWEDASPAFHVAKDDAPFLIVHGTRDPDVPIAQSQELYDKLKAAGVPVEFVKVDDVHTFQTPEARRRMALAARAFFDRYLVTGK
jgi:acetyl esterase/lipase